MKIEWDNYEHLCYKARYEIFSFIGFYLYISPVNDDNGCMDGYRIEIYFQDDIFKEQYCWGKSKDDEDIEEVKENAVELLEEAIKEFNKRLDTKLKEFKNEK